MAEGEKKSTWGLLLKKAGGLIETSKTVAKNVKTAAQEWKEAKVDVMPQQLSSLREQSEFRIVPEFKEINVTAQFEPCYVSETPSLHEIRGVLWVMRGLRQTMHQGGYLTPTLYIPKEVWYQDVVKVSSFQLKFSSCQEILQKLKELHTTAARFENDVSRVCKALQTLAEAIEVIQSGMVFQVSGVEEDPEVAGKEGLDKLKTLSYSFAKSASRIAHSAVDVTKLTPEQNRGYLGVLTALFDESQYIEILLTLTTEQSAISNITNAPPMSSASTHPARFTCPPSDDLQNTETIHPANLSESENTSLTVDTDSATRDSSELVKRNPDAAQTAELVRLLLSVTKLLSRTVLRFVVDDLLSRLRAFHTSQTHFFVDAFE